MAVTFEEIEAFVNRNPDSLFVVPTTIIRTQEDGRTGYSSPLGARFDLVSSELSTAPSQELPASFWAEYFSDRLGSPTGSDILHVFDSSATDPLRYQFRRRSAGDYQLTVTLPKWGATLEVAMALSSFSKIYTGWGPRIQDGSDLAHYCVSFQNAELVFT